MTAFEAGLAACGRGDWPDAERAFREALRLRPVFSQALNNLATAVRQMGRSAVAVRAHRLAIAIEPTSAFAHAGLCGALCDVGASAAALAAGRRAVRLDAEHTLAVANLAHALGAAGDHAAVVGLLAPLVAAGTAPLAVYVAFAQASYETGALVRADLVCRRGLALDPTCAELYANHALIRFDLADAAAAVTGNRRALALKPALGHVHSNVLLALHYDAAVGEADLFRAHADWGRAAAAAVPARVHRSPDDSERRLRVGYVSADFRAHSVAFFLAPLLESGGGSVDTVCYSDVLAPDRFTEALRRGVAEWRTIVGLNDAAVARLIGEDRIDILVDLAGHTARNRLGVFVRRPAPVQVTWLGYPGTTGLPTVDYRLTDAIADPPGEADGLHSETLVRMGGGFLCYRSPVPLPAPGALPAGGDGPITFGSFNNLAKASPLAVALWAGVLHRVPGSRLLLKARALNDEAVRANVCTRFAAHGIRADRLLLHRYAPHLTAHLEVYRQVDIALDSTPYNGTTTTCEALAMGVPVVTLAGRRHAARVGASLLSRVGLADLVASDAEGFVAVAAGLAADRERLAVLRAGLRARLAASPLGDAPRFARTLEAAFRAMWRAYCARLRNPQTVTQAGRSAPVEGG